ncbi:alpha/beta hydrolase [Enterocloster lavalensis]|uniref:Peptidase S9 prolyl oligopeptidase catalytic domain-containing protein n=1 Tax=Enterocloster lavalensis TaxID=460384 RepID=A0A1I0DJ09_9FIRM|nr:alpha/beta hydrolase [Enterocloster lavalensis]SET31615.1 hypothetical protein SAMN05216313_104188 [Enterocloster lavalensis]
MGIGKWIAGAAAAGTAAEYGFAGCFFHRTMVRTNAVRQRTRDMSGTDWGRYISEIQERKEWVKRQPHKDVFIESEDHLLLHATYFPGSCSDRAVICFHSYASEGLTDFSSLARFYLEMGYRLLVVDERAHGRSEGIYFGFGCLDRRDAVLWIREMIRRMGRDCRLVLHGISMGGATALMTAGLDLPPQVKAVISDCAFTSAWEVFSSVLHKQYHMPAFPVIQIADRMTRKSAGYGLDECNAREEVKMAGVPVLFIHGEADAFAPCSMAYELYAACRSPKELLVIPGAGHAEAYYKDAERYERAVRAFLRRGNLA